MGANVGVRDRIGQRAQPLLERGLLLRRVERGRPLLMAPQALHQRLRGVQHRVHSSRAAGAQEVVWILALGQGGEGEAMAGA